MHKRGWLAIVGLLGLTTGAATVQVFDFGLLREQLLRADSSELFDVARPR